VSDFVPQDLRRLAHRWEAEDRAAETLAAAERQAIAEELAPHLPEGYSVAGGSAVAAFVGAVAFGNQPAPTPKNAARFTYSCITQPALRLRRDYARYGPGSHTI
jgi:hypothetical protein